MGSDGEGEGEVGVRVGRVGRGPRALGSGNPTPTCRETNAVHGLHTEA